MIYRTKSTNWRCPTNELKNCLSRGGATTLMVWADIDDDMTDGDALKREFWNTAQKKDITQQQFDQIVFVFAKDRLENWIQYLMTGQTDESVEGPWVNRGRDVRDAARQLGLRCLKNQVEPPLPPFLEWSCRNWRQLAERMRDN